MLVSIRSPGVILQKFRLQSLESKPKAQAIRVHIMRAIVGSPIVSRNAHQIDAHLNSFTPDTLANRRVSLNSDSGVKLSLG